MLPGCTFYKPQLAWSMCWDDGKWNPALAGLQSPHPSFSSASFRCIRVFCFHLFACCRCCFIGKTYQPLVSSWQQERIQFSNKCEMLIAWLCALEKLNNESTVLSDPSTESVCFIIRNQIFGTKINCIFQAIG